MTQAQEMVGPRYSGCIEMLFVPETGNVADRIRMAADAGLAAVEFWHWRNKDLDAIEAALAETGLPLTDPAAHAAWLEGLAASRDVALRLGVPTLIAQAGDAQAGRSRLEQHAAIVDALRRGADLIEDSGVTLALEPLNTRVDHAGYFLDSTAEGLDIVDEVGRKPVALLYDIYHAAVMDEDLRPLAGRIDRLAHVHLADTPGRHEPGSGKLDWRARVAALGEQGYRGYIGLEYRPTATTRQSLAFLTTG